MHNLVLLVALPLLAAFLISVIGRLSPLLSRATGPLVLLVCLALVLTHWGKVDEQAVSFVIGGSSGPGTEWLRTGNTRYGCCSPHHLQGWCCQVICLIFMCFMNYWP